MVKGNNSNTDDVLEEQNPWVEFVEKALPDDDEESTAGNGNGNGGEDDDDGSWSEDGAVEEEEEAREPKGGDDSEAETEADSSEVELEGRQVVIPGFALREDRREAAQGSGGGSGRRGPGRRRRRHPDGGGGGGGGRGGGGDLVLGGSRGVAVSGGQVVGWDVSPGAREVFSQYAACSVQMNRDGNQQLTAFNARSQELLAQQFQRALTVQASGSHVQ